MVPGGRGEPLRGLRCLPWCSWTRCRRARRGRGVSFGSFLMSLSSGGDYGRCHLVAPSVTDQGPQDVDASACKSEHGLDVPFALGALAVIERTGVGVEPDADQRGGVEDALESSVVLAGAVEVAADLARVPWCGGHARESREGVRGGEAVKAATD